MKNNYLFVEIANRVAKKEGPLINLGIGDTKGPLPKEIAEALAKAGSDLATEGGYFGYGSSEGIWPLREAIADKLYLGVDPHEIYISDGSKCDIGRLQLLFDSNATIAVQDPSYPVYVDTSVIYGRRNIVYMPCLPENDFFPDLESTPRTDIIYFCSPNNPTGVAYTHKQLQQLVDFARKNGSIIIFDSAYAAFITDETLPKSIFEIEGARECAIETGSFSKLAGFTGVRLAWTIVPKELKFADGSFVDKDWKRIISTFFNGASILAQRGGLAVLSDSGFAAVLQICQSCMENAAILKEGCLDIPCYGGVNAPYLWLHFPGKKSWDIFDELLERGVIVTPGSGFGQAGEGFVRLSALGANGKEAAQRLQIEALL